MTAAAWESAERVQKNDAGQFRALIGGEWVGVEKAQKNESGQFRVMRGGLAPVAAAQPERSFLGETAAKTKPALQEKPAFERDAEALVNTTIPELIMGSAPGRFAMGAANTMLGAGQYVANAIAPNTAGKFINETLASGEEMTQRGREAMGSEGFDAMKMLGSAFDPAALKLFKAMPIATTTGGRMAQASTVGGVAGLLSPNASGVDYQTGQLKSGAIGAAVAPLIPAGFEAAKAGGSMVRNITDALPFMPGGDARGGMRIANDVINKGGNRAAVIDAMANNKSGVPGVNYTAGQAAATAKNAEISALQEIVAARRPSVYGAAGIEGQQEAARMRAISGIAGTKDDMARAVAERTAVTAPMREQALSNANIGGIKGQELANRAVTRGNQATAAVQDVRRFNKAGEIALGQPRILGRYRYAQELANRADNAASGSADLSLQRGAERNFAQMQADSVAQSGNFPLKAESVVSRIDSIASKPGLRASDAVSETMSGLKEKIASLTDPKSGVINADDLYTIRKEIGLSIESNAKAKGWDKRLTAKLETDVKGFIDDAIEGAGGSGWKNYLKTYEDKSRLMNEMVVGRELQKSLQNALGNEQGGAFTQAVRNATMAPELLRRNAAARYGDIREFMSPEKMDVIDAITKDFSNSAFFNKMAKDAASATGEIIGTELPKIPGTGPFNQKLAVTRAIFNALTGKATNRQLDYLTKEMPDAAGFAQKLKDSDPAQRSAIIDALMRAQAVPAGSNAGQMNGGQ